MRNGSFDSEFYVQEYFSDHQRPMLILNLVLGSYLLEVRVVSPYGYIFCSVSHSFAAALGANVYLL